MDTYRRRTLFAVDVDAERSAALVPGTNECAHLPRLGVQALLECAAFRTIDEHAGRVARKRKLAAEGEDEIRSQLHDLAMRGFLVSKTTLLECAAETEDSSSAAVLDAVSIVTRGRPGAASRCIRSYAANMRVHGRAPAWTVLDSSDDPDARRASDALRSLAREGVELRWAGQEQKAAFGAALAAESHVDPELVRFALFDVEGLGNDTGANRNALVLAHAGEMLLSVDDDTVCELRRAPSLPGAVIELTSFRNPDVTLFGNLEEVRASLPKAEDSVLAAHEELLGRTVGACLRGRKTADVFADSLNDDTLETILSGRARVGATIGGFWGDCASSSSAFYVFSQGPRPCDFPGDEAAYRRLVASRQVLRAPPRATLSAGANIMAANLGMDLRELLPPFFPTGRGQDTIFGAILKRCFPDHLVGLLPLAAGHLPVDPRSADPDALWDTPTPDLAAIVFHAVHLAATDVAAPGPARLRLLGRHLVELGSLSWPEFERRLLRRIWQAVLSDVSLAQNRLREADASSPWARGARAYIETLFATLNDRPQVLPKRLRANRTESDARVILQRLIRRFGELLDAWPDLWAAAQRLRARGFRFAHPLM